MPQRMLRNGRADGLTPLQSIDLNACLSFSDLVRAMGQTAFGGRRVGEALDVLVTMARDADCSVVLTLSGAMTVAKQGRIICEMIDRGMVQAVVATGALIAHGLTESLGRVHYAASGGSDDSELYAGGYNRIYDTLEMEANLNDVADLVARVLDEATEKTDGVWSSARFCRRLGDALIEENRGPGILSSARRANVPVFIPAFTDSEVGLDFATHAMARALAPAGAATPAVGAAPPVVKAGDTPRPYDVFETVPSFNPFIDLQGYARFAANSRRLGILTIGGGVPRNWAQQVGPYCDITADRLDLELPSPRFRYGVRICPEPDHWGGLSGCTYSEGVSWGKFVPPEEGGRYAEVHADATIVLPLLMKAVFEELETGR